MFVAQWGLQISFHALCTVQILLLLSHFYEEIKDQRGLIKGDGRSASQKDTIPMSIFFSFSKFCWPGTQRDESQVLG